MELYILQDKHKHPGQWKQWTTEILLCMQYAFILYTTHFSCACLHCMPAWMKFKKHIKLIKIHLLVNCDNLWKLYAFSDATSLITPQIYDNAPSNCVSPLKNMIKEYMQNYNMGHWNNWGFNSSFIPKFLKSTGLLMLAEFKLIVSTVIEYTFLGNQQ